MWKRIEKKEVDVVKNIKDRNYVRQIREKLILTATLRNKVGLGSGTANNILYRLKKDDKIKNSGRGIYVKA